MANMIPLSNSKTLEEETRSNNPSMGLANPKSQWLSRPMLWRKASGARTWLFISDDGQSCLEEVEKHVIMRRTGLSPRDLRVLDPLLSYSSMIMGREREILVSLDEIKVIITTSEVLVLNPLDSAVATFVQDVEHCVANFSRVSHQATENIDYVMETMTRLAGNSLLSSASTTLSSMNISQKHHIPLENSTIGPQLKVNDLSAIPERSKAVYPNMLPFEFRVLKVFLESTYKHLESKTTTLEKEVYPALDELMPNISTMNLKHLRQIKNSLVDLSSCAHKVMDELEHLLDDDVGMAEMHLIEKLVNEQMKTNSLKGENNDEDFECHDEWYKEIRSKSKTIGEHISNSKPNTEEFEMLLEAYFMRIEGTLNKVR